MGAKISPLEINQEGKKVPNPYPSKTHKSLLDRARKELK